MSLNSTVHDSKDIHVAQGFMVIGYGTSDRESFASTLGYRFDNSGCRPSDMLTILDGEDNDCDGLTDEETCGDGRDNDSDGLVDEDCRGEIWLLRSLDVPPKYIQAPYLAIYTIVEVVYCYGKVYN